MIDGLWIIILMFNEGEGTSVGAQSSLDFHRPVPVGRIYPYKSTPFTRGVSPPVPYASFSLLFTACAGRIVFN